MNKKIIVFLVVVLVLGAGGFFLWQNQKDVRDLNNNLPEGVKVVKSLVRQEYKVVNKVDGYEFNVPKEWKGVKEIDYIPERTEAGYTGATIELEGNEGSGRVVGIDHYKSGGNMDADLISWAKLNFSTFGLVGEFERDNVKDLDLIKTQENIHFGGEYVYFFKKDKIVYTITSPSEEFIREIISNGKW